MSQPGLLALIVAVSENGVIGANGSMPWHHPEDLAHFKRMTLGHAVVMGRKTWCSLGAPLAKRHNIVVTRASDFEAEGAQIAHSLEDALALAYRLDPCPRIIGGGTLYQATLDEATIVFRTRVRTHVDGDTFFPELDRDQWRIVDARTTPDLRFETLVRSPSATPMQTSEGLDQ